MKFKMGKDFGLLLSGQLVSQIGDKFYMLALALWVLKTTKSTAMMGGVLFCSFFPTFLMGVVAGAFVDKYDRKTIIVAADLIRGLVIAVVVCLYFLGLLNIYAIFISQILLSICAAFFNPAIPAVIPQIVKKSQLTRANSMTGFVRGFSSLVGPLLGGIAVASLGYAAVFVLNALSFIISGVFECFLKIPALKTKRVERTGIMADVIEGLKYIFQYQKLVIILIMVAVIHFFVGSIEVFMPVISNQLMGSSAKNLGYIQAFFGLGTLLMALIFSLYKINGKEAGFLFGSIFAFGSVCLVIAYLSFSGMNHVVIYLGPFLLLGSFIILAATCFRTILQKDVANEMAGRVFGASGTIGDISIPIAMLAYGFLLKFVNCGTLLAATGVSLMMLSGLFYRSYRRIGIPEKGRLMTDPDISKV